MPNTYPMQMNRINRRLFPFAVLDLKDLRIDKGHEIPKQITINASNNCDICYLQKRMIL